MFFKICMKLFFIFLVLMNSSVTMAALQLTGTRLILQEGEREASIVARNRGSNDILIQSWLSEPNSNSIPPFAVSPALGKVAGGKQQLLRIFSHENKLPTNRESLFRLSVQEIPQQADGNHLQLAVMQNIKLFYRPKGLLDSANEAPRKLGINLSRQQLHIKNTTPYHINFTKMTQEDKEWGIDMLAPFSEVLLPVAGMDSEKPLILGVVNDYGAEKGWIFVHGDAGEQLFFSRVE